VGVKDGYSRPADVSHSFVDLLPVQYRDSRDYLIMALDLECYFDTGNQADSQEHENVTLSVISGTPKQWRKLEDEWATKCTRHNIGFLHATEYKNRPEIMEDFAQTVHEHTLQRGPYKADFRHGLYPFSVTICLADYIRARQSNPQVPQDAPDVLIREALFWSTEWGRNVIGARDYHLVFDRSEQSRGYVSELKQNRYATTEYPMLKEWSIAEAPSRKYPGLQMADLFAFSHSNIKAYNGNRWHQMVMGIEQDCVSFTYEELLNPVSAVIEKRKQWGLVRRKATR
jgi:hypothetical protein